MSREGKHLTDYFSINPNAPAREDEAYEEEYVISSIAPQYDLFSKIGCLSNHFNQSQISVGTSKATKVTKQRSTE